MKILATKLPLNDDVTTEQFMEVIREWLRSTAAYSDIAESLTVKEGEVGVEAESKYCRLKTLSMEREGEKLTAVHIGQKYYEQKWMTDILFREAPERKEVVISLELNGNQIMTGAPPNCRTSIIRRFVRSGMVKQSWLLPLRESPIPIEADGAHIIAGVIRGDTTPTLPLVYVSKIQGSNGYEVDTDKLAKQLCGLAYVVEEKSEETSYSLRELTEGKNPYNGYIGIYYPRANAVKMIRKRETDSQLYVESVTVETVIKAISGIVDAERSSWNALVIEKAEEEMRVKNQLMEIYDEENTDLGSKVKRLEEMNRQLTKENYYLKMRCQELTEVIETSGCDNGILMPGDAEEFFYGEQYDLVVSLLKSKMDTLNPDHRDYELLEAILQANPLRGEGKKVLEELKRLLTTNAGELSAKDYTDLERIGFKRISVNGHSRVEYKNNSKYRFTLAATPSDLRNGKNAYSDIAKIISVYK